MRIICILLALLLGGCSMNKVVPRHDLTPQKESSNLLTNIRIERWGEQKYSGLLALEKKGRGIHFILLDGTGVKLLEGEVDEQLRYEIRYARGNFKESQLPEFLSVSLARTFLQEPETLPCSGVGFSRLCKEQLGQLQWQRKLITGVIPRWRAVENFDLDGKWQSAEYTQPWLGVTMRFSRIE